jgi:hypothetical protein
MGCRRKHGQMVLKERCKGIIDDIYVFLKEKMTKWWKKFFP